MYRPSPSSKSGFFTVDLLLSLVVLAALTGSFAVYQNNMSDRAQARLAGDQLLQVIDAAESYISANQVALEGAATPTFAATVTGGQIRNDGHLPPTWNNRNAWGQSYNLYVLEPSPGQLLGVVVTSGGDSVASKPELQKLAPFASSVAGAHAGFIPPTGNIPGESENVARGVSGTWTFDFGTVSNVSSPGAGHLAALIQSDSGGSSAQDYLYRVAVPGSPELNQMQTTLDMDGNPIVMGDADVGGGDTEGVRSVNFENHATADFACAAGDDEGGRLFVVENDGLYICRDGTLEMVYDTGNLDVGAGVPVGSVIAWPSSSLPPLEGGEQKWAECDGSTLSAAAYPELFAALGTTTLPDYRGMFLRGWDHGRGVDAGRTLGSSQGDAIRNITGKFGSYENNYYGATGAFYSGGPHKSGAGSGSRRDSVVFLDASRQVPTASENRPKNITVVYVMRVLP